MPLDADALPVPDQPGGVLDADDGRQAVLPRDHGAVGHEAADLGDEARDRDEQRRPAGVGVGGDQDVARLEVGLADVADDAGAPLDGPGGDRQADQGAGRHIVAPVGAGDDLAVRGEHPRRGERLVGAERVLALPDEALVDLMGAHDLVELLEREVEDVLLRGEHAGLHEALGLSQQRLLVDEVAADHAVLRILPVADEGPHAVDHPLGLVGLSLALSAAPAGAPAAPAPCSRPPAGPASKRRAPAPGSKFLTLARSTA